MLLAATRRITATVCLMVAQTGANTRWRKLERTNARGAIKLIADLHVNMIQQEFLVNSFPTEFLLIFVDPLKILVDPPEIPRGPLPPPPAPNGAPGPHMLHGAPGAPGAPRDPMGAQGPHWGARGPWGF